MMDDKSLYRARKRIRDCVSRIQEVSYELRRIAEEEVIPPTTEEYRKMVSGEEEVSYQAHLAGVLNQIRFHVLEVGVIAESHLERLTPKTWLRIVHYAPSVLQSLEHVVRHHFEPKNLPALPGYIPWDVKRNEK